MLSRSEIEKLLQDWNQAWDRHDIDGVMQLFHEDVIFENWTGAKTKGKTRLLAAWAPWFKNHGGFRFTGEETRGVDLIHFKGNKIIQKLTYSQTTIEIDGKRMSLSARY